MNIIKTYTVEITVESLKSGNRTGGSYFIKAKDEKDLFKKASKKMAVKVTNMAKRGVSFKSSDKSFKIDIRAKEDFVGPFNINIASNFSLA